MMCSFDHFLATQTGSGGETLLTRSAREGSRPGPAGRRSLHFCRNKVKHVTEGIMYWLLLVHATLNWSLKWMPPAGFWAQHGVGKHTWRRGGERIASRTTSTSCVAAPLFSSSGRHGLQQRTKPWLSTGGVNTPPRCCEYPFISMVFSILFYWFPVNCLLYSLKLEPQFMYALSHWKWWLYFIYWRHHFNWFSWTINRICWLNWVHHVLLYLFFCQSRLI